MASSTLPVPVICCSCGQTVTDANHRDAVRDLNRHRCPNDGPEAGGHLFDLPEPPRDPRRFTR
jgi:hypothetical protein